MPHHVNWQGKLDFEAFIVECVRRWTEQLRNSKSLGKSGKLLERQWQMEFYRYMSKVRRAIEGEVIILEQQQMCFHKITL
jgi:hypothetical protein